MKFKTLLKKFVQNAEIDIVEVQHETYWADLECDKQDTINDHLLGHELALMTLELRYSSFSVYSVFILLEWSLERSSVSNLKS